MNKTYEKQPKRKNIAPSHASHAKMAHLQEVRARLRDSIQAAPAVRSFLGGRPSLAAYRTYLINVWHYAQHSATVIGLAGSRCVARNRPIANYLFHHAKEELGHELWALEDLETLGVSAAELAASRPVPSCAAMIGYEYYIAGHANPVSLFGWLYVLEAMGEDLGPVMSSRLTETFGRKTGVHFIEGHGEADEAHTHDLTAQIIAHIPPEDMADVNHVADVMAQLYAGIFEELLR
jgi:pyrroloquinoline quinone (PQQ) biosynthesis protein C